MWIVCESAAMMKYNSRAYSQCMRQTGCLKGEQHAIYEIIIFYSQALRRYLRLRHNFPHSLLFCPASTFNVVNFSNVNVT